jgi:hypothetical protein
MLEDYHTPPSSRFAREFPLGREPFETSCVISKMWLSAGARAFGGHGSDKVSAEIAPTKRVKKVAAMNMVEVSMDDWNN